MTRYTLTIPRTLNDGTPTPPWIVRRLEEDLAADFGGFTRTDGEGAWYGEQRVYREPVTVYAVDTDDPDALDVMKAYAERIAGWLDQEAVYVTAQPINTYLVSPARATA